MAVPGALALMSDERLARLVGQSNERAFGTLYSRYHQPLYRYCYSMVRHEADAQDALQSTFTSALAALRRSQRDAPLRPWLYRIAHNESISLLRRRRVTDELPETMEATGSSVEHAAEERARLSLLVDDLRDLPERQRGALVMRELSGLSHEELAQALGISVGAAKQSVFEARQAMQEFAEGRAMACNEIQRIVSDGDRRALRGRRVRAHLRECSRCDAFAHAIPERRTALLALTPMLPAAAASGLFTRITGAAHHGGSGHLLATAGGKSLGAALSAKSVATGLAIVATATAGTVGAVEVATHAGHSSPPAHVIRGHRGQTSTAGASGTVTGHPGRSAGAAHGRGAAHQAGRGHAGAGARGAHGTSGLRSASAHNQNAGSANLGASATNPNAHGGNPNATGGNTGRSGNGGGTNPNAHGGNPNANGGSSHGPGATNPNAHGGNPNANGGNGGGSGNAGGTNPNAHGGNPNAAGGSTNAHGGNPNAAGGSTNAHGGNPNAHGGNPNAGGGNPNAGGVTTTGTGSSNAHGGNPNSAGGSSHGNSGGH